MDPVLKKVYGYAAWIYQELKKLGFSDYAASYGVYQMYHETGAFTNLGFRKYNNMAGIMFAGQKGAAKAATGGYAHFNSWADFFRAYTHEMTKGANPAGATNLEDFNSRLVANHYYKANPHDYLSGMKRARLVLKVIPAADRAGIDQQGNKQAAQDMDIPGTTDYTKTGDNSQFNPANWPLWGKVAGGVAAVVIIAKLLK
jgi:hypothetical protein